MTLHYRTAGSKVPLVLVHAWPLSSRMWERQLKTLSDHATVITPDIPGLGQSPRQRTPSIPEIAQSVAGLLDQLKISDPIVIGGLSMGGYVALEFLRQFPGRVRGLCLLATRANADTPEVKERRFKTIEFLQAHPTGEFLPKVIPNLLGATTRAARPELIREVESMILANSADGICDTLRAMAGRNDSTELLGKVHCPAIVMAGAEDGFVTPEESKAMHAKIPGADFHLMANTGHLLNLENPSEFDAVLGGFLKKNYSSSRSTE